MKFLSLALTLAAVTTVGAQDKTIPQPITLTGCVTAGEKANTYMLTHVSTSVTPLPVGTSGTTAAGMAAPFYWLDSAGKLKGHAGHRVEVIGMLDDDIDKTTSERKGGKVVVKTEGGRRVEVPESTSSAAAAGAPISGETKRLSYKVKVKSVRMLGGGCPQGSLLP